MTNTECFNHGFSSALRNLPQCHIPIFPETNGLAFPLILYNRGRRDLSSSSASSRKLQFSGIEWNAPHNLTIVNETFIYIVTPNRVKVIKCQTYEAVPSPLTTHCLSCYRKHQSYVQRDDPAANHAPWCFQYILSLTPVILSHRN